MIILDENILDDQRLLLEASRVTTRQIGVDVGRKGMKDDEIAVLLRQQRYATFFTRDKDSSRRSSAIDDIAWLL